MKRKFRYSQPTHCTAQTPLSLQLLPPPAARHVPALPAVHGSASVPTPQPFFRRTETFFRNRPPRVLERQQVQMGWSLELAFLPPAEPKACFACRLSSPVTRAATFVDGNGRAPPPNHLPLQLCSRKKRAVCPPLATATSRPLFFLMCESYVCPRM
jgi:hypothetical protein